MERIPKIATKKTLIILFFTVPKTIKQGKRVSAYLGNEDKVPERVGKKYAKTAKTR